MKKIYFNLLIMLIALLMPSLLTAQKKVFEDKFESGLSSWTQIHEVGTNDWLTQSGENLFHPKGSYEGSGRAYFQTNNQNPSTVKLVSPQLDCATLDAPILAFSYANAAYPSGAYDVLRVYARANESSPWQILKEYTMAANNWVRDTVVITNNVLSSQTQIAFEGVDNSGHGIVLDDVYIGNQHTCPPPTSLYARFITSNSAYLNWTGTEDGNIYHLKVSSKEITDFSETADILDDNNVTTSFVPLSNVGLQPATRYYFYVKVDCGDLGEAEWSQAGTFVTTCTPVSSISESFEDFTPASEDIKCWSRQIAAEGTTTPADRYPYVMQNGTTSTTKYTPYGVMSVRMYGYYSGGNYTEAYLISPELAQDVDLSKMMVSFSMFSPTDVNHKITVGVQDIADDLNSFQAIQTVSCKATNTSQQFNIYLNEYVGTGKYISFRVSGRENQATTTLYIDNIILEPLPTCENIVISKFTTQVDEDSAIVSWNPVGTEKWNVKVSTREINPATQEGDQSIWSSENNPVTGTPRIKLTGLNPNAVHYVYVQPTCEEGTGTWSEKTSFTTPCGKIKLPFIESFDTWGTSPTSGLNTPFLQCWSRIQNYSTATNYPYCSATYKVSGAASLYFYSGSTNNTYSYAITPEIDMPADSIKHLQLIFQMRRQTATGTFAVGVMTDPNDISTFTPVVENVTHAASVFGEKVVNFASYTGSGKYIALRAQSGLYVYIDDFQLHVKPDCDRVNDDITISDIAPNSVVLNFTTDGNETAWDVAYGKTGFNIENTQSYAITTIRENDSVKGLEQNSIYDFYVRANCGTEVSRWRGPVTAQTLQTPATVPYFCDFEEVGEGEENNSPDYWTLANSSTIANKWIIGNAANAQVENSTHSLYVSNNGQNYSYNNVAASIYAYRDFYLEEGIYDFSFQWNCKGYTTTHYGRAVLAPGDVVLTPGTTLITGLNGAAAPTVPPGWIALDNKTLNNVDTWQNSEKSFTITKSGVYKVIFFFRSATGTKYDPPLGIDNVSFTLNSTDCYAPVELHTIERSETTLEVGFHSYNNENWKIKLRDNYIAPTDVAATATGWIAEETITKTSHKFENLQPGTMYYYYVQAGCGGAWVGDSLPTICTVNVPFYEEFSKEHVDTRGLKFPLCWSRETSYTSYGSPRVMDGTSIYEGAAGLNFPNSAGTYSFAVSPRLNIDEIKVLRVKFMHKGTANNDFTVGIIENPDDMSTFVPVTTIKATDAVWHEYEIWFNNYTGNGKYVGFLATAVFQHMDNVLIDSIPGCPSPKELAVTGVSPYTADITWSGLSNTHEVVVSKIPFADFDETIHEYAYEGIATGNSHQITGLDFNTTYYYKLKSVCEGKEGEWSVEETFTTACIEREPIPYKEYFDTYGTGTGRFPTCFHRILDYVSGTTYYPYISTTYASAPGALYVYSSGTTSSILFSLPLMDEDITKLTLSFSARKSSAAYNIVVGIMTDINDPDSFDTISVISPSANNVFETFSVPFTNYTGNGEYIAFRTVGSNTIYLDNIEVKHTIITCATPVRLRTDRIKSTEARIRWADDGSLAPEFAIQYSTEAFNPIFGNKNVIRDTVNNIQQTLTDLAPNTTYYFSVQALCGDDDKSYWADISEFTTICSPVDLPYTENFSTYGVPQYNTTRTFYPTCWRYNVQAFNSPIYEYSPHISYPSSTDKDMFLKIPGSFSAGSETAPARYTIADAIMPEINTADLSKCQIVFKYAVSASPSAKSILKVGVMNDWLDPASFIAVDTISTDGNGVNFDWKSHITNLSNYRGQGKYIAFRVSSLDSEVTTEVLIDSLIIMLTPTDCPAPTHLTIKDIDDVSATVSWRNRDNDQNEWEYVVTDTLIALNLTGSWQNLTDYVVKTGTVNTTSAVITGLQAATTYYCYVRATCGDDAYFPGPLKFTTDCPPFTEFPYIVDMSVANLSAGATVNYMECWKRMMTFPYSTPYPYLKGFSETAYIGGSSIPSKLNGDTALHFYSSPRGVSIAVSPKLDTDLSKMRVRFKAAGSNSWLGCQFAIGVMTNSIDETTFVGVDTITVSQWDAWENFRINLNNYTGTGKYVAFRFLTGSNSSAWAYLKDIIIDEASDILCDEPFEVILGEYSDSEINVSFATGEGSKWEVVYGPSGFDPNTAPYSIEVTEGNVTLTSNVTPNTCYDIYIRTICETQNSIWTEKISLCTQQIPAQLPYICSFEDELQNNEWAFVQERTQNNKWIVGTATNADANGNGKALYISDDGSSYHYTANPTNYAIAYRTVEIPEGRYTISYKWKNQGNSSNFLRVLLAPADVVFTEGSNNKIYYNRQVAGGSSGCNISQPAQPEGWINLGEVGAPTGGGGYDCTYYPHGLTGSLNWKEYKQDFEFAASGKYKLVVFWQNGTTQYPEIPAAIDSIQIVNAATCTTPVEVQAYNIGATSVDIRCKSYNSTSYRIKVSDYAINSIASTDGNIIKDSLITTLPVHLENLAPDKKYYIYMQSPCDTLQGWGTGIFKTECGNVWQYSFEETFATCTDNALVPPSCWTTREGKISDILDTGRPLGSVYSAETYCQWRRDSITSADPRTTNFVSSLCTPYYGPASMWLVSPAIEISNTEESVLTFDVAVARSVNNYSTQGTDVNKDWQFMFVISDDNGATWKRENAVIWNNNGTGDYVLSEASPYFSNYSVNLAKYKGKIIKIGFCAEVGSYINSASNFFNPRIDNVKVNCAEEVELADEVFQGYPYEGNGFNIPAEELNFAGDTIVERIEPGAGSGCNIVYTLNLTVIGNVKESVIDSFCEGTPYNNYGVITEEPGEYTHYSSLTDGRDKITYLTLTENPTYEFVEKKMACVAALPITWHGQTCNATGTYYDNLTSSSGCDSIYVLELQVVNEITQEIIHTICRGDSYLFGDETLTEPNTYVKVFTNEFGCDSTVTLHLSVVDAFDIYVEETICRNGSFTGYGWENQTEPGIYTSPTLTSVGGCDSTFTLNLIVAIEIFHNYEATICEGDTYSDENFPSVTEAGEHRTTYTAINGGCDSTVVLTLSVAESYEFEDPETLYIHISQLPYDYNGYIFDENTVTGQYTLHLETVMGCDSIVHKNVVVDETGLLSISANDLIIEPNPVVRGGKVYVNYPFTSQELDGMKVEVFNSTGVCIKVVYPDTPQVSISDLNNTGMYLIRVTTGDNKELYGKLIVQ